MFGKEVVTVAVLVFLFLGFASAVNDGFETSSVLLKVSLEQGKSVDRSISISSDVGGDFIISVENVNGVSIAEDSFVLDIGEQKNVIVTFDSTNLKEGIYIGTISIFGGGEGSLIPVVFEIESKDAFFDVNVDIPPQYTEIKPGETMLAQMKVFDLTSGGSTDGLGPTNVEMEYLILGNDGSILSSETEKLVIDKQTRITKTLLLPFEIEEGNYVFASIVKYKTSVGVSSQVFSVFNDEQGFSFDFGNSGLLFIFVIVVLIFFLVIISLFVYMVRSRDKMFLELRKYNRWEMNRERKFIVKQDRIAKSKGTRVYRTFKKKAKKRIKKLKRKQKSRILKFKEYERKHNNAGMIFQVKQWKKLGYNTSRLEKILKKPSMDEMSNKLESWKKKYKT